MPAWNYMVTWEHANGPEAPMEVLNQWRTNLTVLGDDGYELVAEHYSESADGQDAWYRGTLKRPL
jgi:hypothetical protein